MILVVPAPGLFHYYYTDQIVREAMIVIHDAKFCEVGHFSMVAFATDVVSTILSDGTRVHPSQGLMV
jgi:hypothetical protein